PPTAAELLASTDWRLAAAAKLALDLPAELQASSCLLAATFTGPERELVVHHALARPISQRIIEHKFDQQPAVAAEPKGVAGSQRRLERVLAWSALATIIGAEQAEAAALVTTGIANPTTDWVDLADYQDCCTGLCLAARLTGGGQPSLARIAAEHNAAALLPALASQIPLVGQGISRDEFTRLYGSATDERFLALRAELCAKILAHAAYR
ncbi:MAG TPA: hypothetical protein VG433_07270, partial [Pirellulales bacterium]|nr:hypothetical protein [Pirellulales bacterium]